MSDIVHLAVIQGEDKGKQITLPPEGVRIGRSSKNDVILSDPLLSRHHCRIFFRDDALWITDLGSANTTVVNKQAIQECPLHRGDEITLGDTVIEVCLAQLLPVAPTDAEQDAGTGTPVVDLGLADEESASPSRKLLGRGPLLLVAGLVAVLAIAVWIPRMLPKPDGTGSNDTPTPPAPPPTLHLEYEKIEGDAQNIFRYYLEITEDNTITVEMDDLANNRHYSETKAIEEHQVIDLARAVVENGFFSLQEEYRGIQPNILHQWDIRATVNRKTHRSTVINRVEPELFREIRERIEVFGKNELGTWAQQFTTEELQTMAGEAFLLGKKLHGEREVRYGNLSEAVKSFNEAKFHLDTLENKPDYYGEMLSLLTDCKEELQRRYNDHNFRAEQSIRLKQWKEAAHELRILCEMIPDRSDDRNRESRNKLLEVETRIKMLR